MNLYQQLKNSQQKRYDEFEGVFFAFNKEQFEKGWNEVNKNLEEKQKVVSLGYGCYLRKDRIEAYRDLGNTFEAEMKKAIEESDQFIFDMFYYELANHEYCVTYELDDTLDALNLTREDIKANKRLQDGLQKARTKYLKGCDF